MKCSTVAANTYGYICSANYSYSDAYISAVGRETIGLKCFTPQRIICGRIQPRFSLRALRFDQAYETASTQGKDCDETFAARTPD